MNSHPSKIIDFLLVGQNRKVFDRDIELLQKTVYKNVRFAVSGPEARVILKSCRVKFVISELDMPHMNGIELLKMIRRNPGLVDIPVLLISNDKNKDMILYARDELADGFLVTPYSGKDLLGSFLRIRRSRKHLSKLKKKVRSARRLFLRRNYKEAIQKCRKIISVDENNIDTLLILSECYYRIRDIERARQFLKKVLKLRPNNSKAMHLLSKVCRLDTDCGEAFSQLKAAHNQNPLNNEIKIDLGKFYLDTGLDEKAHDIFESVMTAEPSDLNLIKIGKAFFKKNQLSEARRFLDKTVQPLPETTYIFQKFAEAMEQVGEHAISADYFLKCQQLVPDNQDYAIKRAKALASIDQNDEARETLNKFLKEHPGSTAISDLLESL